MVTLGPPPPAPAAAQRDTSILKVMNECSKTSTAAGASLLLTIFSLLRTRRISSRSPPRSIPGSAAPPAARTMTSNMPSRPTGPRPTPRRPRLPRRKAPAAAPKPMSRTTLARGRRASRAASAGAGMARALIGPRRQESEARSSSRISPPSPPSAAPSRTCCPTPSAAPRVGTCVFASNFCITNS